MSSAFIDFDRMFEDFMDEIKSDPFLACPNYSKISVKVFMNNDNKEKEVIVEDSVDAGKYLNLLEGDYRQHLDLDDFYIFGINENGLKFAQHSKNYLLDELYKIKDFIDGDHPKFIKNLDFLYFITDKEKDKIIAKANKKKKVTIYNNPHYGADILHFIDDNDKNIIGRRLAMQNYVLSNLNETDNIRKKFIIILSFDVDLFEIYYSVPYNLYDKGSNELEKELIYCCRFDEIDPNKILTFIDENSENLF